MSISLSDASAVLEKIIQPAVYEQLCKKALIWRMFGGTVEDEMGRVTDTVKKNSSITQMHNDSFYIPVRLTRHSGVITITEGNSLVSGKPTLAQAQVYAKWHTGTFNITKQTLAVKDTGSAVNIFKEYGKLLARDMYMDLNRQLYGTGNGAIGKTAGAHSGTTVTFLASTNNDIDYADYAPPGSYVNITGSANLVVSKAAKNQIVVTNSENYNGGTNVYKCDAAGNVASELTGLNNIVSATTTCQGLDVATYPQWVAGKVDATGGTLALDNMSSSYFAANKNGDGVDIILMNQNLFRKYGSLLQTYTQFPEPKTVWGGWKSLEYMGGNAKVMLDYDCPDDKVYFLDTKSFTLGELSPFQFEKGTDGTLLRVVDKLEYQCVATWFGNLGVLSRSSNAVMTGCTGIAIS